MKFYLNNQEIKVLNGASFSIKQDETLDSGKIELIFSNDKTPIKPMVDLRIEDNNDVYNFVVMSDTVEIASKEPKAYKHTIEFVQSTKKLSKIQVRNTQFSQPAKDNLKCIFNQAFDNENSDGYMFDFSLYGGKGYSQAMEVSEKHKVKGAYIKINTYYMKNTSSVSFTYQNTLQDTCPKLSISFDIYNGDTIFESINGIFENNDILYLDDELTSGTYTIKNLKVVRLTAAAYSDFDFFIINVSLNADVYYYSLYDVLDILRKQVALEDDYNTGGYAYYLPSSGDLYTTLKNTIAPNLTFTQCTLYDCLEQVFMYLDAYPILDKSNTLGIRYFNDNNGKIVTTNESDMKMAMSEKRYVNGLMTDFQNADLNSVIIYPSKKTYSSIQSKNIGIPSENDYIMRVDYPIYKMRNVRVKVSTFSIQYESFTFLITWNSDLEITQNVIPQDIYVNLNDSTTESALHSCDLYKQNCLYYKQNSNEIEVYDKFKIFISEHYVLPYVVSSSISKFVGYTGTSVKNITPTFTDVKTDLKYQIEYETLGNGRLLIEGNENKYKGAERLDIGQGASDIMKMGLNLIGTSIKTGVDTLVRTERFRKNENRIKVGNILYDNGNKYIATKVDDVVFSDFVYQTIEYSKNYNKLSQFIALDQKKRFNEVDSSLTLKSEDVYKEYLYFSLSDPLLTHPNIHLNADLIKNGFEETFKLNPTNDYRIDFATCETSNLDGTSNEKFGKVWLPIVQYGSGNALCFEMAFSSPINANSNMQYTDNRWYSTYILYTYDDAFADKITINFYNQIGNVETSDLPKISDTMISSDNATRLGGFKNLLYYKKPNEIFALNYELLCLPYKNQEIFIGERFIKYNGIIGNAIPKKEVRLYTSDTEQYSILDKTALGSLSYEDITIQLTQTKNNEYKAQIYGNGKMYRTYRKIVSWAITDENSNILISVNQKLNINDYLIFYIFTSHSRL